MTFKQLQDDTLEMLDFGDPAQIGTTAQSRVRIKRHLNEAYHKLLAALGMGRLRSRFTGTISLVADTARYTVTASKIDRIYDQTNRRYLEEVSLDMIRRRDADESVSGTPEMYAIDKIGATTFEVYIWPIPSGTGTLYLDDQTGTTELSADGDIPVIPEDFHDIIGTLARMKEYEKKDDGRYRQCKLDVYGPTGTGAGGRLGELRLHMRKSHSMKLIPSQDRPQRRSRLGGYFEAGT